MNWPEIVVSSLLGGGAVVTFIVWIIKSVFDLKERVRMNEAAINSNKLALEARERHCSVAHSRVDQTVIEIFKTLARMDRNIVRMANALGRDNDIEHPRES